MRTVASLNRKSMVRARGGQNKGVTLKQVKAKGMPRTKGIGQGK